MLALQRHASGTQGAVDVPQVSCTVHGRQLEQMREVPRNTHEGSQADPSTPPTQTFNRESLFTKVGKGKGEGDPAGTKEAETNAEIEVLQQFIEQAKKWGMGTDEAEGKLKQLQTETQPPTLILTETMNLKDSSAEKYRILTLHTKNKDQHPTPETCTPKLLFRSEDV